MKRPFWDLDLGLWSWTIIIWKNLFSRGQICSRPYSKCTLFQEHVCFITCSWSSVLFKNDPQWRSQSLPGCPGGWIAHRRAKMRKELRKVWGKTREIDQNSRKKLGKWKSRNPGLWGWSWSIFDFIKNLFQDYIVKAKMAKPWNSPVFHVHCPDSFCLPCENYTTFNRLEINTACDYTESEHTLYYVIYTYTIVSVP